MLVNGKATTKLCAGTPSSPLRRMVSIPFTFFVHKLLGEFQRGTIMSSAIALLMAASAVPDLDRAFIKARATMVLQEQRAEPPPRRDPAAAARKLLGTDPEAASTVCAAASKSRDPWVFLASLGDAYRMSSAEKSALKTKCSMFLRGIAEARRRRV
jgi:hypothetical protein